MSKLDWIIFGVVLLVLPLLYVVLVAFYKYLKKKYKYIIKFKKVSKHISARPITSDGSIIVFETKHVQTYIYERDKHNDLLGLLNDVNEHILDMGEFETDGLMYVRISALTKSQYINSITKSSNESGCTCEQCNYLKNKYNAK